MRRRWEGPDWFGIERVYQHETLGRLMVPTIVRLEGDGCDISIVGEQARPKGSKGKRPPAAPRGGGEGGRAA
jgi:hypothetical protein